MSTAPNVETYSQVSQLSDANPDGTQVGQSATDKIGFWGKIPLVQRTPLATNFGIATSSATYSASTAATAAFGNWYSISSSPGVATSTYTGYVAGSASSASSNWPIALAEIGKTLVALGFWSQS